MRTLRLASLTALSLIAGPTLAQIEAPPAMPMVDAGFHAQMFRNVLDSNGRSRGVGADTSNRVGPTSLRPTTSVQARSTAYTVSPAVRSRVKQQYVDFVSQTSGPQAGAQVRTILERGDPVQSWAGLVASNGLRPGDAADALAAYWILNWMIANQGDGDRVQALAVREQVRGVMGSNPAFMRLNEAQRQEMAEALMLNFLMQHAAYNDAYKRGDQATMRRLGDAAVARFRSEMDLDLRRLQLTNNGFVRRG